MKAVDLGTVFRANEGQLGCLQGPFRVFLTRLPLSAWAVCQLIGG